MHNLVENYRNSPELLTKRLLIFITYINSKEKFKCKQYILNTRQEGYKGNEYQEDTQYFSFGCFLFDGN